MTSSDERRGRPLGPRDPGAPGSEGEGAPPSRPVEPSGPAETVVAIGASAGGLHPLREFLQALPPDPGAGFVVLQHLSPDTRSLTPELLQRHVSMPLRQAEDGAPLQPNEVVFLPPGAALVLENGCLKLVRDEKRPRTGTVIDTFLSALARERGPRAVGILLSGGGWDGTQGLKAIKEAGGLTMAQDPDSAEFESMPASAIRAAVVDVVQPAAELAVTLAHYLERGDHPADLDRDGSIPESLASKLTKAIQEHTGHDFSNYKRGTLARRVSRRCRLQGWSTLREYVVEVERDPDEARRLVEDLLIGVTGFFRDPESWEALEENVVPDLFAGRGRGDQIRAWVIGCATGEEAYSLAIALNEHAAEQPEAPLPMLFATDIDTRALDFARDGVYPEGSVSSVPPARRARFFKEEEREFQLADAIREQCIFAEHNVLRDPPFSKLDLVSCRNLMIYLEPRAQESLAEILGFALKPGGYLLIGASEHLEDRRGLFEPLDPKHRIFRRTEVAASLPTGVLGRPMVDRRWMRGRVAPRREAVERPQDARRPVEQVLLQDFGPAALLVNERREVLDYFGRTRRYIEPSQAQGGRSVIEMALPSLRGPLRSAIRAAEQEGEEVVRRGVRLEGAGVESVDVTVRPVPGPGGRPRLLIVFQERAADEAAIPPEGGAGEESTAVRELEEELHETQERLQATIEHMETTNEELQSTNEELLSMNEEFQTSKEEALSANEELQLVNAELRAKVTELDKAHADLENLFRSTQVATLFLDRESRIQRFTPTMSRLFRLRDSDVGRPIGEITRRFECPEMEAAVDRVLQAQEAAQMEVHVPEDDVWYSLRVSPYRAGEDAVEGVVLTFADITEVKRNEVRIREEQLYAQSIIETVEQPLVVLDSKLRVVSASRSFFEKFAYAPDAVLGSELFDLGAGEWDFPQLRSRLEAILPKGAAVEGVELEFELPRLGRRWLTASARRLFSRETDRILLNLQDVTDYWERVRAQEEEARRKDWFLAMLGHELRGPLAPIRNSVTLLDQQDLEPKQRKRLLEIIARQVAHLARLVGDLLDLSRIAEGKLSLERVPLDLVRVVRDTVEDHRPRVEECGLRLELVLPEGPIRLQGDPDRLGQAFGNLIDNARKYTHVGGRVTVTVRSASEAAAEVVVEDTGIGMSREMLDDAFQPFRQGPRGPEHPEEGLGVGLTLVRTVVDAHGGAVRAESDGPGRGARFTLRFPVADALLATTSEPGPRREGPRVTPHRIVLVEDQGFVAETTCRLLELGGHTVTVVADGRAALEIVREIRPDVVICDLGLPGGMTGHDVARAIRSDPDLAPTYLIALTGFGRDKDRGDAVRAGFDAFLIKPASAEDLAEALSRVPARES